MSLATQRRSESPRKVSLGVIVTTAQKPHRKHLSACGFAHILCAIAQQSCGRGARAPGCAAGGQSRAALASSRPLPRKAALAGCGALRKAGPAATRESAARADSPGRPGTPIGPWCANQRPQLSLQRGRGLYSGAAAETLGPRLAASTKRAGGRCAALLRTRASPRADAAASLKPFEKCPFERKRPRAGKAQGKFVSFFKLFWSP